MDLAANGSTRRSHRPRAWRTAGWLSACVGLLACALLTPLSAQERRAMVFGDVGGASLGHADSEQGRSPIVGGGVAFQLTPRLSIEGDVHGGKVTHVFGRADHDFSQATLTGSLLFRAPARGRVQFVSGGGVALQRAHIDYNEPPFPPVDRVETLTLLHGRIGADWAISDRLVLRTHGGIWMGGGLDWVFGARAGLGYRF
jgi:hypothetical protein